MRDDLKAQQTIDVRGLIINRVGAPVEKVIDRGAVPADDGWQTGGVTSVPRDLAEADRVDWWIRHVPWVVGDPDHAASNVASGPFVSAADALVRKAS